MRLVLMTIQLKAEVQYVGGVSKCDLIQISKPGFLNW
jgi:hypothetical protein